MNTPINCSPSLVHGTPEEPSDSDEFEHGFRGPVVSESPKQHTSKTDQNTLIQFFFKASSCVHYENMPIQIH